MSSISQDFLTHYSNFPLFQYSHGVFALSPKSFSTNYVLRIYRFGKSNPRHLVGVVEEIGIKGKKAFTNYDELWDILNFPKNNKILRKTRCKKAKEERNHP